MLLHPQTPSHRATQAVAGPPLLELKFQENRLKFQLAFCNAFGPIFGPKMEPKMLKKLSQEAPKTLLEHGLCHTLLPYTFFMLS